MLCLRHVVFEFLLCARLYAKQFACCVLLLQAGNRVTEEHLKRGPFTEVWASSKESAGAGQARGVHPKGTGGGQGVARCQ